MAIVIRVPVGGGGVHVEQPGGGPIQRAGRRSLNAQNQTESTCRFSELQTGCHGISLVTLAAGRCFSGLSPLDDDDACLSRDWLLLGQSGLDDIMLPEAGRGG